MMPECPYCNHHYEREPGYWLNAMIVATAVTEGLFAILFVIVLIATLPDVAWIPVLIVGAVTNVIVPTFFYPLAKTTWVAIDTYFRRHPML